MHTSPELAIIFIVCFTLVVGAAMSMLTERVKLPYTIAMLLVGMATGALVTQLPGEGRSRRQPQHEADHRWCRPAHSLQEILDGLGQVAGSVAEHVRIRSGHKILHLPSRLHLSIPTIALTCQHNADHLAGGECSSSTEVAGVFWTEPARRGAAWPRSAPRSPRNLLKIGEQAPQGCDAGHADASSMPATGEKPQSPRQLRSSRCRWRPA